LFIYSTTCFGLFLIRPSSGRRFFVEERPKHVVEHKEIITDLVIFKLLSFITNAESFV